MKKIAITSLLLCPSLLATAQTNPVITGWLRNTTGITGRHYVSPSTTPVNDTAHANVQLVQYSTSNVYIYTQGIPAYITGPFLDGNPSLATAQHAIFKLPQTPAPNTGTPTPTTGGNIAAWATIYGTGTP
jgi:hypothetical protein